MSFAPKTLKHGPLQLAFADNNAHKAPAPAADSHAAGRTASDSTDSLLREPLYPKVNGDSPGQSYQQHRPDALNRSASDKAEVLATTPGKNLKDPKPATPGRRSSWVSTISSKFSPSLYSAPPKTPETSPPPKSSKSPQYEHANPFGAAVSPSTKDERKAPESPVPAPSNSPRTGHGFLQSAMRRLSSSAGTTNSKAAGCGGICPRKTMNIDPYRERCSLLELEPKNLRRVAFCVDVEIAGAAQYPNSEPDSASIAPSLEAGSSLTGSENHVENGRKQKDQQFRESEGAALKRPTAVPDEKVKAGGVGAPSEKIIREMRNDSHMPRVQDQKEPTRKQEKKKRSESERKERKERKQKHALANGKIPAEIHRDGSSGSTVESAPGADISSKSQDRPTTDPLRIYRRCCQLRETPILKRIAEQISLPAACSVATPGILSCLDLSGYWMQLPDIITLGDYLAVVPVKKLLMEDCGLGDEAVRVILAGLLAAKTPEQAKFNKKLSKKSPAKAKEATERLGIIEKVCFKNNPKIGREGWRHIALFIHMSRSLKAIDLSMIPFPQYSAGSNNVKSRNNQDTSPVQDMASIIQEAIATRLAGNRLEELVLAECKLSTNSVGQIVDSVIRCGSTRLGLASNGLTKEGFKHVLGYVRSGQCEGLDIGGNDLRDQLDDLASALDNKCPLFALSVADCNLAPSSLANLLPALTRLANFRFIDLSHNRDLFATKPSAFKLVREHLPQFPILKRLHLLDVSMTPEHAIALAEVLPECKNLAHLNILENHLLSPLANAKTEAAQEEACALYASFMTAVRVSESIICVDIDVPSPESSEIVKALAKQVVAYSLRNLERLPLGETSDSAIAAMTEPHGGGRGLTVPDILLHLVGHVEGYPEYLDNDEPAPDDDYIVGGTGVVKALDICLKRAADGRKSSPNGPLLPSGTDTPHPILQGGEVPMGKAKDMSKNLLGSARKIRARLQPALIKEARTGNEMSYRRLQFLDSTLERMIQRFEDEYPETRLSPPPLSTNDTMSDNTCSLNNSTIFTAARSDLRVPPSSHEVFEDDPSTTTPLIRPASLSHRSSSPSLASRQAQEEGRMHRFGQRLRRDIFRPETEDHAHGTTGTEEEAAHIRDLRRRLELLEGPQIQEEVSRLGPEAVIAAIGASAEELAKVKTEREGPAVETRHHVEE
ncbi:MAG: hypothetical protein Q9163_001893 [Psora crenata]